MSDYPGEFAGVVSQLLRHLDVPMGKFQGYSDIDRAKACVMRVIADIDFDRDGHIAQIETIGRMRSNPIGLLREFARFGKTNIRSVATDSGSVPPMTKALTGGVRGQAAAAITNKGIAITEIGIALTASKNKPSLAGSSVGSAPGMCIPAMPP